MLALVMGVSKEGKKEVWLICTLRFFHLSLCIKHGSLSKPSELVCVCLCVSVCGYEQKNEEKTSSEREG